ncbi:LacI family transcriptional regulator [Bacillus timonensis]|uniref:LacI family transcriptional regulator n=1 Tax=Bacillus timonensis TaxID=1033734 RepID=A0A4V6RSV2_9BACI|nr:LacI family DNA-binding transcriptional regulator [Bacillus timonensis]THE11853.1 LacI family transcriptional regulator [Bacillus timonensis]
MVTMKDVAKRANVSTATVSRVLRNFDSVKEESRTKVLEAMKELNYQPNLLGRYLRTNKTKTIFVVIPEISNYFHSVLNGIENIAIKHGYQVLIGNTQFNAEREYEYYNYLRQKKSDGMILFTSHTDKEFIEGLADQYSVVLAGDYFEGSNIPTVSIDDIGSARKATEYLIQLGHNRIAHITGRLYLKNSLDRISGYRQVVQEYQQYDPQLIQVGEGDYSYETGFVLTQKLLCLENPPDAIFAATDEMAIGAINAIKSNGLRVPEDLSVVGFNDNEIASVFNPSLTTVAQPQQKIGETAMELLISLLNDQPLPKSQLLLESKLVIRNSTRKK